MNHPEEPVFASFLANTLDSAMRAQILDHVSRCVACQRRIHLGATDATGELGAPAPELPQEAALQRGSLVGRYVVIEVLGAGGMGEVYTAIDPELDRRVALKLVRAQDTRGSAERQTRLLREAQAMAKLSHPNVVSIFDVGVVDGRVFLAMELVTGSTLTHWLERSPRGWREVLEIFKQAGTGLSAAHHAGMIHRDFKPDNILIGTDGRVRVSDFGLARASSTDTLGEATPPSENAERVYESGSHGSNLLSTPMTQGVLGTPGYMAPEQLLGTNIDEKSDQFSFCVSLYKALYGETPFRLGSRSTIVANITAGSISEQPEGSTVPAWVRRIVLKGLNAAPKDRFESIDALIAALERDPRKARNKWLTVAGIAVGVLCLIGSGLFIAQRQSQRCRGAEERLTSVWDEERQHAVHLAFTATGLPYAEAAWRSLKDTIDRYSAEWLAQEVDACEATWLRGEQSDAVLTLRSRCLNDRLDELRALSALLAKADIDTVRRASKASDALTVLSRCSDVATLERGMPLPKNDESKKKVEALEQRLYTARSLLAIGKTLEALPLIEAIVTEAKEIGFAPTQAKALLSLIRTRGPLGKYDGLREIVLETVRLAEISGDDSIRFQALLLLASTGLETGQIYDELMSYCRLAESALLRIQDRSGWHQLRLAVVMGNVAVERGRLDEAEASYAEGVAFSQTLAPSAQKRLLDRISVLRMNLAYVHSLQGQFTKALGEYALLGDLLTEHFGSQHPEMVAHLGNVAELHLALNRLPEALVQYADAQKLALEVVGPKHLATARVMAGHADVLRAMGRLTEAENELRATLAITETIGARNVALPDVLMKLARTLVDANRAAEALPLIDRAIELDLAIGSEADPHKALIRAASLRALNRLADAEQSAASALRRLETTPFRYRDLFNARFELAQIKLALHHPREARALAEQALGGLAHIEGDTQKRLEHVEAFLTSLPQ